MLVVLDPGGKPERTYKCIDCDPIDPLKSPDVVAWIESETLKPPTT